MLVMRLLIHQKRLMALATTKVKHGCSAMTPPKQRNLVLQKRRKQKESFNPKTQREMHRVPHCSHIVGYGTSESLSKIHVLQAYKNIESSVLAENGPYLLRKQKQNHY